MYYLVYQITNALNGKIYIGAHKTEDKNDGYMGSGKLIKRAIKKYGLENFKKDILFEASSSEEMFFKEKELVVLGSRSYNIKDGGCGGWDHVIKSRTKEEWTRIGKQNYLRGDLITGTEQKIILMEGGLWEEFKQKRSSLQQLKWDTGAFNGFSGHRHSVESKAKIGLANSVRQSGENNSHYGKMWIMNTSTGESVRIFKEDKIPTGWIKGRKINRN